MKDIIQDEREYNFNEINHETIIKPNEINNYLKQLLIELFKRREARLSKHKPATIYLKLTFIDTQYEWYLSFDSYSVIKENDRNKLYLTNDMIKKLFQNIDNINEYVGVPQEIRSHIRELHNDISNERKNTIIHYSENVFQQTGDTFKNTIMMSPQRMVSSKQLNKERIICQYNSNIRI